VKRDEVALASAAETGLSGPIHNPWDLSRVAGGASAGSAAAVAAGEIPLALGTDSGGGIRQPCALCGVTGIKPTYGAVSRFGIVACASSLDQAGTIGQDIEDCAALLSIISGPDKKDGTCVIEKPFDFGGPQTKGKGAIGLRIALTRNYFDHGVNEDVKKAVLAAAKEFEAAGAIVEEIDMPLLDYVIPAYCVIESAEVSSNLARFDGLKYGYKSPNAKTLAEVYRFSRGEGFGTEVKRSIMLGSLVLSSGYYEACYKKALRTRTLIRNAYKKLFERFDMILSPSAPDTAHKPGEYTNDPMKMYMGNSFNEGVNLAGLPAVALPCGFDKQGLPIGFQLIGAAFSESKLIGAARVYQGITDFHTKKPPNSCACSLEKGGAV